MLLFKKNTSLTVHAHTKIIKILKTDTKYVMMLYVVCIIL